MTITASVQANIYDKMKRCLLLDNGTVNYYLDPTDSTKKADGTPADLSGADGQVMVEIPKVYSKRIVDGTYTTWKISHLPIDGYTLHPAFIKDGVEVNNRYIGAYDACVYDTSAGAYVNGLNLDNADSLYVYADDKLSSVSGKYPVVGITRAQARQLASNRGSGWRQLDFALLSLIQLLYIVEYQSLFSQNKTGAGNTVGSYLASSSNQNDSPHTIAGASNALGNGSTNTVSGAGVSAKPGVSFMSYRGIENLYGNTCNFIDGINVNIGTAGTVYVSNNADHFADDTSTNYSLLTSAFPTSSGYSSNFLSLDHYFLPGNSSGGSTTTYITDYGWRSASLNRMLFAGGFAGDAGNAGVFCLYSDSVSTYRVRVISARLAF